MCYNYALDSSAAYTGMPEIVCYHIYSPGMSVITFKAQECVIWEIVCNYIHSPRMSAMVSNGGGGLTPYKSQVKMPHPFQAQK